MRDLNDLYYFAQVVEHQGFAPASRALHVPKSKLSRRIALLEEQLGVRLIQRSSRHFSVTDIGQEFYRHCQAMLVEANAADEAIAMRRAEPQGTVRLSCPIGLLHVRVSDILADFMLANPKVTVMLEGTNRRVDVIAEGFDMAIRARPPPLEDSDLVLRVFAERSWRLVASPVLLEQLGRPAVPADLNRFPTVDTVPSNGPHVWELQGPARAQASLHHAPRLVSDDMIALRAATMRGVGITQLPHMIVSDQLRSGELVELLPGWSPRQGIVHAVYPSRRGMLPAVRALLEFLTERLRDVDE
jgi:DNA-binding transcriptional LysR family regulator